MPRYFFDVITNGTRIVDFLGAEFLDREAARVEAIRAAVEMIANNALENAVDAVSLFVAGEGLSTGDVCKTNGAVINAAAARSPVLAQGGVE